MQKVSVVRAFVAAGVVVTIWLGFWAVVVATSGTQGLLICAAVNGLFLFASCLAYALVNWP